MKIDYKLITDIVVDDIDHSDAPDYTNAFILSASYEGREMTEDELGALNSDSDFLYEAVRNWIY